MTYTTAKAAEKIGISAHTLRFYDKEGLLPNVGRDEHGNRRLQITTYNGWVYYNVWKIQEWA